MEKAVHSYETMFIVNPTISEDAVKATVEKFTTLIAESGSIGEVNEWGKRRLAYPINDIPEGYYVLVNFTSASDFPAELDRRYNIDENIMRGIVIRLEQKKAKSKA